jgi:flagellar biosynthesis protein FlhG
MSDQADRLRRLMGSAPDLAREVGARLPMVVVSGSRREVGATTVAMNLGAALSDRGREVVVGDVASHRNGLADLAGIGTDFDRTVSDIMAGECSISEAIVRGPAGVRILAERWTRRARNEIRKTPITTEFRRNSATAYELSRNAQQRFLGELDSLRTDVDAIVLDAGCGLTPWSRRLWMRAGLVVIVTTTESDSVLDAYKAIKLSVADAIQPKIRLLVNQAESAKAAEDTQRRLQNACSGFLQHTIDALPALPRHDNEIIAGGTRWPRVWESPNSAFGHAVLWLGRAVEEVLSSTRSTDMREDLARVAIGG